MEKIEFTAYVGDLAKRVEIDQPHGGGDVYFVMIDRYYFGMLQKPHGYWQWHPSPNNWITADEIQIIPDMIDQLIDKE